MRKRATRDHIVSEFDLLKHQHTDSPRNLKPEIVEQPSIVQKNRKFVGAPKSLIDSNDFSEIMHKYFF